MMKTGVTALMLILHFAPAWGSGLLERSALIAQARRAVEADAEIQKFETANSAIFKYPSVVHSPELQTVKYRQIFIEPGTRREWDVFAGRLFAVRDVQTGEISLENELVELNLDFHVHRLLPLEKILAIAATHWQLLEKNRASLTLNQVSIEKKIWRLSPSSQDVPVYWLKLKGPSRFGTRRAPTLVVHAETGHLITKLASVRSLESKLRRPKVQILNGNNNKTQVDQSYEELGPDGWEEYCQVVSRETQKALTLNAEKCRGEHKEDASMRRAKSMVTKVVDFFLEHFDYFGLDNDRENPKPVQAVVHAGHQMDNAFYDTDTGILAFGDGTGGTTVGESTVDFTHALDVAGHEYAHGINAHTAQLIYNGESGALDEGTADILGVLIERTFNKTKNWIVGEDLFYRPANHQGILGLRSIEDPDLFPTFASGVDQSVHYPRKVSEQFAVGQVCDDTNDFCDVHANAMIWSHTFYRALQKLNGAGLKKSQTEQQLEIKLGKLYFLALTHRFRETESFRSAARKVNLTCKTLFTESECQLVRESFVEAEILK